MLRLHPSTIVLTHDEVNKVLTKTYPAYSASPDSSGAMPWDHNITLRRQRRKGKQRAESTTEVRLDLDDQTLLANFQGLSPGDDRDNGYNGGIEEDLIDLESLLNTADASIDNAVNDGGNSETQPPEDEDSDSSILVQDREGEEVIRRVNQWKARNYRVPNNSEELGWRIYQEGDLENSSENDSDGTEYQADEELDLSELQGTLNYPRVRRTTRARQMDGVMEEIEQEEIDPEGADETFIEPPSTENHSGNPQFTFPFQNFQNSSRISWASSSRFEDDILPRYHDPVSPRISSQSPRMQPIRPQTALSTRELSHSFGINGSRDNISTIAEGGNFTRIPQGGLRFLNDVWRRRNFRITMNDPESDADAYDDDYVSDDSLSGVQLPADVVATLDERTEKLQIEAAKRTIR
ncbi:hypothetical protein EDC01DRAFT_744118 [Geopyxis carbonaria]|nr:hypothetical protein EDC01DRAFT_744118 [Geopyxis carbonaria]